MQYFKAQELVLKFKVSERTVYRWVEDAAKGKLPLTLVLKKSKKYIEHTQANILTLESLTKVRIKYKNKRSLKIVKPKEEFFEIFSGDYILDIIKNIEIYKEVPFKYTHSGNGAILWATHIENLLKGSDNMPKAQTSDLISFTSDYILNLISTYDKVNLIEIGPGSGLPTKDFVSKLLRINKLNKYIVFDISKEMTKIWESNIAAWFKNTVQYEIIRGDITKDHFQSTAFQNLTYTDQIPSIINLIFFVGGTIENDRNYSQQLSVINNSMGPNDIFVLEQGVNEAQHIEEFPYKGNISVITSELKTVILDLLNIRKEFYTTEQFYSAKENAKLVNIRFNHDVIIEIEAPTFSRRISFAKGETLTIWRYNCHSALEVINELDKNGFKLLSATTASTRDAAIFVAEVQRKSF